MGDGRWGSRYLGRDTREHWENWTGLHGARAERRAPRSYVELRAVVGAALRAGRAVRAVGAGHASSPVARPATPPPGAVRGVFLDTGDLRGELDWPAYASGVDASRLVRVEGGITVDELLQRLHERPVPLTLPTSGSYWGQTIAGAVSTATHGSGLGLGTMADYVRAIEILVDQPSHPGGDPPRLLRIEPATGQLTDAAGLAVARASAPAGSAIVDMTLHVSDDDFHAAVVSLGNLGIVYALTLECRDQLVIDEHQVFERWEDLSPRLLTEARATDAQLHYEVTLMPRRLGFGRHAGHSVCLVTRRRDSGTTTQGWTFDRSRRRKDPGTAFLATLARLGMRTVVPASYALAPALQAIAARSLERRDRDDTPDEPYRELAPILRYTSVAPEVLAEANEIAVPLDRAVAAIDTVIALANEDVPRPLGCLWYHTSPVGIRFVRGSPHFLSPTHGTGDWCYIESPLLVAPDAWSPIRRWRESRRRTMHRVIEERLGPLGARAHWGQSNYLAIANVDRYPATARDAWRDAHDRFNPRGLFSNAYGAALRAALGGPT